MKARCDSASGSRRFSNIAVRMWGVATTIEKPASRSPRQRATPSSWVRTPSSTAGT